MRRRSLDPHDGDRRGLESAALARSERLPAARPRPSGLERQPDRPRVSSLETRLRLPIPRRGLLAALPSILQTLSLGTGIRLLLWPRQGGGRPASPAGRPTCDILLGFFFLGREDSGMGRRRRPARRHGSELCFVASLLYSVDCGIYFRIC